VSPRYVAGAVQRRQARRSILHWNLDPRSVDRNRNVALLERVSLAGAEVIRVFGGVVSSPVNV